MAVTTINIDSQVLTFANLAAFPVTGTVKTIYIAEDTNFQYYWDGSQYVQLTADINIPANLIFYATTAPSSVPGYERLVISPDDVDYDNPAVDVPTGAITTTAQLVGEQIADANIFAGNPGVINISTIGEIRRTSGTGTAKFYFEIYQRTSLGVETLRGTSNLTLPISGAVYQQFQVDCLFNNGTWLTTDRVVIKFYADRVAGGSNPNYDFLFGGANPVRTLFPISAQLLLNVPIAIGITGVTGGVANEVLLTDGSGKLGQSELKTVGGNSLFGSGDIPVGGGITIGTTAITSGTVNRILFQGAGDVVQQDSTFVWNNTDKRLILGTEAVADTNSRLVVIGKGTGTNTTFAVHNSTGTNNALVVTDDTRVGIGAIPASNVRLDVRAQGTLSGNIVFRVRNSANNSSYMEIAGDGTITVGQNNSNTFASALVVRSGFSGGNRLLLINDSSNIGTYHGLEMVGTQRTGYFAIETGNNDGASITRFRGGGTNSANAKITAFIDHPGNTDLTGHWHFRLQVHLGNAYRTFQTNYGRHTLIVETGIAPSINYADGFIQYSADIVAGNAAPHFRTENGDIVKIYRVGGWGLPTGSFTRTTFDTTTVTLQQLAERVAALIQDLRDNHQLLKA